MKTRTKYAEHTVINLDEYTVFSDVFPHGIPSNSYINKAKTGLGMTYSEFYAKRNSIIVVPGRPIIKGKAESYKELKPFKVWKGTEESQIRKYIKDDEITYKKLIATPESFYKIINAFKEMGELGLVFKEYFCFIDEAHCYCTDGYRQGILIPFNWFWEFENKALGTATPYHFSEPRFMDLNYYQLKFNRTFGTINLIVHHKPQDVLIDFINRKEMFPGRVHVFFNSVREIQKILSLVNTVDVAIFCSNEERNLITLKEHRHEFRDEPNESAYKKFNFYSCKYNEGWDLNDDETATMILVTDSRVDHSLVEIQLKGFQAIGRLRSKEKEFNGAPKPIRPNAIYHITNTLQNPSTPFTAFEDVKRELFVTSVWALRDYRINKYKCLRTGLNQLKEFKEVANGLTNTEDIKCKLDFMKLDQKICKSYYKQFYHSPSKLAEAWREVNYDVKILDIEVPNPYYSKESQAVKNMKAVMLLDKLEANKETFVKRIVDRDILRIEKDFNDIVVAKSVLGSKAIIDLQGDIKRIKQKISEVNNDMVREELQSVIDKKYQPLCDKEKLLRADVKQFLQEQYQIHGWYDTKNKEIAVAKASHLEKIWGYKIKDAGKTKSNGRDIPSIKISKVKNEP